MKKLFLIFILLIAIQAKSYSQLYPYLHTAKGWGFVDQNNKVIIKPQFSYAHPFDEGIAAVQLNGLWGFIDDKGKLIAKYIYIDLGETNEGLIPVCNQSGKWGYIDLSGKTKIPFLYDNAKSFNHGLSPVSIDGLYGFIDEIGNFKIDRKFRFTSGFNDDGFALVAMSYDNVYIIDTLGNVHDYMGNNQYVLPSEGIFQGIANNKWGFFDLETRKNIIPHEFDLVYHFNSGLAPVRKGGKWGYINKDGKLIIPYLFDDANPFSEGFAVVKLNEKKGYIDTKGNYLFEPQFESAGEFRNEVAEVNINGYTFYVSKYGKKLID